MGKTVKKPFEKFGKKVVTGPKPEKDCKKCKKPYSKCKC